MNIQNFERAKSPGYSPTGIEQAALPSNYVCIIPKLSLTFKLTILFNYFCIFHHMYLYTILLDKLFLSLSLLQWPVSQLFERYNS
jgi:hypothetical protein